MQYFERDHITKTFNIYISFSYFLFINDFEIYRNMYRALKTFYFISIYLFYEKRRKIVNVFILILNLYDINLKTIVKTFNKIIK